MVANSSTLYTEVNKKNKHASGKRKLLVFVRLYFGKTILINNTQKMVIVKKLNGVIQWRKGKGGYVYTRNNNKKRCRDREKARL